MLEQAGAEVSREEGKFSLWLAALCLECLSPAKHYQKQLSRLRVCLGLENMRKGPLLRWSCGQEPACTLSPSNLGSTQRRLGIWEQDQSL